VLLEAAFGTHDSQGSVSGASETVVKRSIV